jgi:hypothetical protein
MAYRTITLRQRELDQLLKSPRGTVGQHMAATGGKVTREAQRLAASKLKRGTGRYQGSFRSRTISSSKGPRVRVENTAPYAGIIEKGSRPHIILPRRGRVLRFDAGGTTVFTRRVDHPGTRPYRILETALRRVVGRDT